MRMTCNHENLVRFRIGALWKIMKQCPKCNIEKNLSEFNKNRRRKDGLQRICKVCSRIGDRKCYVKSKELNPRIRFDKNREVIKRRTDWINTFKDQGCVKCDETRYYVLDFHHIDPNEKDFPISGNQYGYEKLKKEIEKCIVLCSNCHREFHHLEHKNKITIQEYLNQ
jgi:hypothetical protein